MGRKSNPNISYIFIDLVIEEINSLKMEAIYSEESFDYKIELDDGSIIYNQIFRI